MAPYHVVASVVIVHVNLAWVHDADAFVQPQRGSTQGRSEHVVSLEYARPCFFCFGTSFKATRTTRGSGLSLFCRWKHGKPFKGLCPKPRAQWSLFSSACDAANLIFPPSKKNVEQNDVVVDFAFLGNAPNAISSVAVRIAAAVSNGICVRSKTAVTADIRGKLAHIRLHET